MNEKELEKLLHKVKKLARDNSMFGIKFQNEVQKRYGFTYGDRDLDSIIDVLDYGHGGELTFKVFIKTMEKEKKNPYGISANDYGEAKT